MGVIAIERLLLAAAQRGRHSHNQIRNTLPAPTRASRRANPPKQQIMQIVRERGMEGVCGPFFLARAGDGYSDSSMGKLCSLCARTSDSRVGVFWRIVAAADAGQSEGDARTVEPLERSRLVCNTWVPTPDTVSARCGRVVAHTHTCSAGPWVP